MNRLRKAALILALVLFASPAPAETVLKTWDFGGTVSKDWATDGVDTVGKSPVLGLFNNRNKNFPGETSLTLVDLPAGPLALAFDLVLVGKWDSEGDLADRFTVQADHQVLLEMTAFPCRLEREGDEATAVGGDGFYMTSKRKLGFWIVPVKVDLPAPANGHLTLRFKGKVTGNGTEFWALRNVRLLAK